MRVRGPLLPILLDMEHIIPISSHSATISSGSGMRGIASNLTVWHITKPQYGDQVMLRGCTIRVVVLSPPNTILLRRTRRRQPDSCSKTCGASSSQRMVGEDGRCRGSSLKLKSLYLSAAAPNHPSGFCIQTQRFRGMTERCPSQSLRLDTRYERRRHNARQLC